MLVKYKKMYKLKLANKLAVSAGLSLVLSVSYYLPVVIFAAIQATKNSSTLSSAPLEKLKTAALEDTGTKEKGWDFN